MKPIQLDDAALDRLWAAINTPEDDEDVADVAAAFGGDDQDITADAA